MRTELNRPSRHAGLAARALSCLAALAMLPLALHAGDGVTGDGVTGDGVTGDGEPQLEPDSALAAALSVVNTGSISADIHFIASDQMRGRYTPSPELEIVARYLRARLQRLGFEPGEGEDFLFEYDLDHKALDREHTVLKLTGVAGAGSLAFGEDFFYSRGNLGEDGDTTGAVVFCGGGSEEELEDVELEGAWALVLDDGESRSSYRTLRGMDAVGVIYVPTDDYAGEPYAERFQSASERLVEGYYAYGSPRGGSRRMSPFSQLYLSAGAAAKLQLTPGLASGTKLPITITEERRLLGGDDNKVTVENVCGMWRGSDPELSKEVILVSAHYDHIGVRGDEICNGADDNGSGTTGLLAVAEALTAHGPFRRSVMLIWVSGEERGLWGSAAWKDAPVLPEGFRAVANLNIDMIGRNAPDELYITPTAEHEKHNFIVKTAARLAPLEGFPELGDADKFYGRSDQANFEQLGIPVAFLFSGLHDDYHQPSDTPDKIDCDKIRRVSRLVVRLIDSLQTDQLDG